MGAFRMGILSLYVTRKKMLEERRFFAKVIARAARMGVEAYVFTPEDVRGNEIYAHVYIPKKGWSRKLRPFPDVILDRCRYQPTARFRQLRQFRAKHRHLLYMNRPLANKWVIYRILKQNAALAGHLPQTRLFDHVSLLSGMLEHHPIVYLKPVNGTGGRGIVRIMRAGTDRFLIQGRSARRSILPSRTVEKSRLLPLMKRYAAKGNYIVQEGIDNRLSDGRVHDFRLLIQKNGQGMWQFTGGAGRVGAARSITSNLHGGGRAMPMDALLARRIRNAEERQALIGAMERFCHQVAEELQGRFHDMCELALDIAVDRQGRFWLLEINPKPSREVFARIGETGTYETSIRRLIEYAQWLHEHR